MKKNYQEQLQALKELLPWGGYGKIAEKLEDINLQDVKNVFGGRIQDDNKIIKIISAANQVIKAETRKKERLRAETAEVVKQAKSGA